MNVEALFFDLHFLVSGDCETSTISQLAPAPKGSSSASTTNCVAKSVGKSELEDFSAGDKSPQATGNPPLSAQISGKDVQELESTGEAKLGCVVATMAKESEQACKEEGRRSKGAERRRRLASLRCCTWWLVFIVFYHVRQCGAAGDAVLQGVCQLREGELPENLKKMLPDENKECLREQQRKLNKQRNILNKIQSKQRALEKDKEQWSSWIASVKEEIQLQKAKHEESQKRLTKELEDLQNEEKRLNQSGEEVMELEQEQELEDFLVDLTKEQEATEPHSQMAMLQRQMEEMYQKQLEEDRRRMQQHFSEQFQYMAAARMDPYLGIDEGEGGDMVGQMAGGEGNRAVMKSPPGLIRNPVAPFGVQRPEKTGHVSSPYGPKEKIVTPVRAVKQVMGSFMEPPDTGQGK